MKKSQLKKIIRESIKQLINERMECTCCNKFQAGSAAKRCLDDGMGALLTRCEDGGTNVECVEAGKGTINPGDDPKFMDVMLSVDRDMSFIEPKGNMDSEKTADRDIDSFLRYDSDDEVGEPKRDMINERTVVGKMRKNSTVHCECHLTDADGTTSVHIVYCSKKYCQVCCEAQFNIGKTTDMDVDSFSRYDGEMDARSSHMAPAGPDGGSSGPGLYDISRRVRQSTSEGLVNRMKELAGIKEAKLCGDKKNKPCPGGDGTGTWQDSHVTNSCLCVQENGGVIHKTSNPSTDVDSFLRYDSDDEVDDIDNKFK